VIAAVTTHLGEEAAAGLRAIAMLGGQDELRSLLEVAPWRDLSVTVIERELALPPLEQFVARQLAATPLAAAFAGLPGTAQAALVGEAAAALQDFRQADGTFRVPFRSNVATALA
jgi:hypothetical protein